ncbi:23S rRNA pseudouridine(2604) synthase RluF [Hymenobacter sp. BT18]|uniref:23S rRNA pseudouridine(2604) synthase RluF n=1 Tax=Hymenobacter sp. BT18 TaxID=2835648 RepID=UPI00143E875B|nr:23S rRNA pseudouridine(2604) synthase RluF [Hymenobacter sp. BT18]QIX60405.1 23S rRNA pseudouridine(2604) synthase RluF [Hymenobacter sp. BT18]
MATRLNKYISESGICSRREADRHIEQGNVLVNGKRAAIGDQVTSKDRVVVNGIAIEPRAEEDAIYIAYNKPPGIVTTTDTSIKDNIIRAIKHSVRIFPVGRLDKESQGLILLTSNGDIVNKILRAGNQHEKEYVVMVDKPLKDDFIEAMANGVPILGVMTQKCKVVKDTPYIFRITLIQGMNRQIRRMCEHFGYEVVQLERIRVMNISIKGLGLNEWRELTEKELKVLFEMLENSSSADDGSVPRRRKSVSTATQWADRPGRKTARPITMRPAVARPASTDDEADAPRKTKARPAGAWVDKPAPGRKAAGPKGLASAGRSAGSGRPTNAVGPRPGAAAGKASRPASAAGGKRQSASKSLNRTPKGNSGNRGSSRNASTRGGKRS